MLETLFNPQERFLIKKNKLTTLKPEEQKVDVTSDEEFDPYTIKINTKREQELFDKTSRYKAIIKRRQSELHISSKSLPKDQRRKSRKY